ncbi:MAG: NADH-quinone oxidoreductase subunit C [Asgard group archaeon]|nr:NADH-quinone oxidoreductase subunit C [Asgard group archaeon]
MSSLTAEQEVINTLKDHFGDKIHEAEATRPRRIRIKIADPDQVEVFKYAKEYMNAWHMIAISSIYKPDGTIGVVYHFDIKPPVNEGHSITMNLHVDCEDNENPKLQSVVPVIPGAGFFEREAYDLMGINFEGHPDLRRLILPDDFEEGVHPLRKDFLLEIQKEEANKKGKKN